MESGPEIKNQKQAEWVHQAREVAEREKQKSALYARQMQELEIAPQLQDNLADQLSQEEQRVVREEMKTEKALPFESPKVKTDPNTFLKNEVVKAASGYKISKRMGRITRRLLEGALLGVAVLTAWEIKTSKDKDQNVPGAEGKPTNEKSPIQINKEEIDMATLDQLSPAGQNIYLYSMVNVKTPYLIVDKPRATMYVIGADKKMAGSFPVLMGKIKGETPNTANPNDDNSGPGATTPAGTYLISHKIIASDSVEYQGRVLSLYNLNLKYAHFSVHATYPDEIVKRTAALNTPTISDNRMTWGCINLDMAHFETYILDKIPEDAPIFITPEDTNMVLEPATGKILRKKP